MHDPSTRIADLHYPWYKYRPWPKHAKSWDGMSPNLKKSRSPHWKEGYKDSFASLWHEDPETDGSDDSCGWFSPKLGKDKCEEIKKIVRQDIEFLYKRIEDSDLFTPMYDPISSIYTVYSVMARSVFKTEIKPRHLPSILLLSTNTFDGFRSYFVKGEKYRLGDVERLFICVSRSFARLERPWYKHPRYHFWHYRLTIHPLQKLKRFLFTKCTVCNKGFKYGDSNVCTDQWDSEGPRWFKSENVYHGKCKGISNQPAQEIPDEKPVSNLH